MKCVFYVSALYVDTLRAILTDADVIFTFTSGHVYNEKYFKCQVPNMLSVLTYKDYVRIIQDYLKETNYEGAVCNIPLSILKSYEVVKDI